MGKGPQEAVRGLDVRQGAALSQRRRRQRLRYKPLHWQAKTRTQLACCSHPWKVRQALHPQHIALEHSSDWPLKSRCAGTDGLPRKQRLPASCTRLRSCKRAHVPHVERRAQHVDAL